MRWGARLAAITMLVTATAAVQDGPRPAPVRASSPAALLVGDSVMNGLAQSYAAAARGELAARHSYVLDTAGCRRLITTSCSIDGGPRPSNALSVVQSRAGQYNRTLVIAVGYNDPPTGAAGLDTAVDVLIQAARESGISDVVWLTYREAGPAGNVARFRANNDVLRAKVGQHSELRLADWNAASAGLPPSWFSGDGIHLGAQAADAMADLIGDALDAGPSPRCDADTWQGDAAPPVAAAGGQSPPGGLHLLDAPLRLLDTRQWAGKLGAGRVVSVPIGGAAGVHDASSAAVVSLVAVEPCADAYLTAYPCGASMPLASALNAPRRSTTANTALVSIGDGGAICIFASEATDVIVDLTAVIGADGSGLAPVAPQRLVDTRPGAGQALDAPQQRVATAGLTVDVGPAVGGVAVDAISVNLTAVNPAAAGFLTLLPGACSGDVPSTSSLNVDAGRDVAVSTLVRLDGGRFCVFSDVETDVVLDLQALHHGGGSALSPIAPVRVLDTRSATQRVGAGSQLHLPGVVPPFARAAVLNITAVDAAASGYLSVEPCGATGEVSNVNYGAGSPVANMAVVPAGSDGDLCVFTSVDTHVVIDVEAWAG